MGDQPTFTITVLYILGVVYALLFFYALTRLFKLRKFTSESTLAKVFYIVLSIQILLDTVFFFILPQEANTELFVILLF
jgi:hypothetical protein